jgi:hypothetical protein
MTRAIREGERWQILKRLVLSLLVRIDELAGQKQGASR